MTKEYKIGTIPGDGTGPEVIAEGIKVLNTVSQKYGFRLATRRTISVASVTSGRVRRFPTACLQS